MAQNNTVIIGAGIIGCSTAYYLSQSTNTAAQSIHLVEASEELFKCASGFAGGFLAKDWFAPVVAPLGALSFQLHRELAEKSNGRERWGYSSTITSSLSRDSEEAVDGSGEDWLRDGTSRANTAAADSSISGESQDQLPPWLTTSQEDTVEVISSKETTAQVDPLQLSKFLLDECLAAGVHLHHPARAISISKDTRDDTLASIRIHDAINGVESNIPCTRLVLTAGAWTPAVFKTLFPASTYSPPISALAGHSLLLKSPRWTPTTQSRRTQACHALFAPDDAAAGFAPEIFARRAGELYIAGLNSSSLPLPDRASDAVPQPASIDQLKKVAELLLGHPEARESDLRVIRESVCFRPVAAGGRPLVGRVDDGRLGGVRTRGGGQGGVFVAAGHGAWGISQCLGTGKVVGEMVEGRETSVDVGGLGI
ncbi:nucleotide-binding domain-containing protein [Pseudovirgaria hyperparasitica]|uniref:Nucleotide-binding domain-containing protein n=1 Tax=Pseudovirgaria hyperparasitica TaxID=470096 RepID=A0A6A6WH11_9PEZI|nr:nucleotide-binding domain-containing protein [Pseudovirgaria hyperparasitica]KAF2761364.1 nucleotide-binding domain-containing protein [Pseudovirgaria hyperparasitica]